LPSTDRRPRYPTAREDICQHRLNNDDWDDDWIFEDPQFGLLDGPESADALRALLAMVGTEISDCPRLFTIVRVPPTGLQRVKVHLEHYRITLWCEYPGHCHRWPGVVYTCERTREWFRDVVAMLLDLDPSFGDMRRVRTGSGEYLWICPEHVETYEPGLPFVR